jgi:hypothetical protein
VWTFCSGPSAPGETAALPLTTVPFTQPVDEWSRAADDRTLAVAFTVQRTGARTRGRPRALTVEVSFDGGTAWRRVPVAKNRALVPYPALATRPAAHIDRNGHDHVSLRFGGSDLASTFEVRVKKVYTLKK